MFGVEPGKDPQTVKVTTFGGGGGGGGGGVELPPPHEFNPMIDTKAITQRRSALCRRPFHRIPAKTMPKEIGRARNGRLLCALCVVVLMVTVKDAEVPLEVKSTESTLIVH